VIAERKRADSTARDRRRVPVSQEEDRQAELYAAFEALGGQLTWDELTSASVARPPGQWPG
jgi:hypothetical protein